MNILFLGGDKRYKFMMDDLSKKDNVSQIGFETMSRNIVEENIDNLDLSKFDVVIFPISGISEKLEIKSEKGLIKLPIQIFDNINDTTLFFTGLKTKKLLELVPNSRLISFLDDEEVEKLNNSLTVDGTLEDLKDKKKDIVCILGYGVLGKAIYWKLKKSGIKTYVISRPKDMIYKDKVENFYPLSSQNILEVFDISDIVINTIPYNVIPEDALKKPHIPYILDIASVPYGIDENLVKKYKDNINYKLYLRNSK